MRDTLYKILAAPTQTVKEIRSLMEQMDILAWSLIPGAIRYDVDRVQTSPVDRMAEAMSDLDEMQRKLKALEERRGVEWTAICTLVMGCTDLTDMESTVVMERYAESDSWDDITAWHGISASHAFRLQRSALDKLEAFLLAGVNKMQDEIKN